jgi:ABC-2 type transport system ATP-binding protein
MVRHDWSVESAGMSEYALRTEHLTKRFRRVEALRGLDMAVPVNSIYALVGPNGAGKTTAIKILMNIIRPTSGHAEVLGMHASDLSGSAFTSIGYVSENQDMPEWMTVGAFLDYLRPFYPTWDRTLEEDLVRQFDLPRDRRLKALSRGMKMKVALASSLAYHPSLIVLDEPFTGLDPLVRDELIQGLLERAAEATVFISSHDLAEIETFASHVGYVERGRLLFSEEMSSLSQRFREVEVSVPAPLTPLPAWPETWMQVETSDSLVRFIDSRFDPAESPQQIKGRLGQVRDVTFTPMSLRAIFVAVARSNDARNQQVKS